MDNAEPRGHNRGRTGHLARVPASAKLDVLDVVAGIALDLTEQRDDLVRSMTSLLAEEIEQLDTDPQLVALLESSVHGNVSTILHILSNNISVEHLQPTTAAVEYALRLAQRDVSPHSLVRAYHMGQDNLMHAFYRKVEELTLPVDKAIAVLKHISEVVYSYIDWITLYVFDAYEQERQQWFGAKGNVHSSTIHGLLNGTDTGVDAFESELGYILGQTHVAVIAWITDSDHTADLNHLDRAVHSIARALHADGAPVVTAIDRSTLWAWVPFGRRHPSIDTAELDSVVPQDIRVVLGLGEQGVTGFRRSHEQARTAYSVISRLSSREKRVSSFGDPGVAVVALLADNLDSTRAWVWGLLGPLADDTDQAAVLRTTLSTYFETGESHLRTAQRLNLHRNTIKYRINKMLGDPSTGLSRHSKLDLALALLVCEFLGTQVLRDSYIQS
ncbi:PucR family transcriptional regulator [Rhodococcus sp. HNM0563]|uniref:PucR family transcriptional regulator n=1 Tax=Rhodococcus sp. HNM0563 TaxID=2716339 RepID=UPI00146F6F02|nr:helix-turn-helix domain-containing protein [Rhodococcus sp. HNM0563]NLU63959.1 PucR family transcriptional regulator [Rhodococcus sp. HNM0563]